MESSHKVTFCYTHQDGIRYNDEIEEKLSTIEENKEDGEEYFDPDIMSRFDEDGNLKDVDYQSET